MRWFAVALPALLAVSSVAAPAGIEGGEETHAANTAEARLAIEAFGKCVAERHPREAARLLRMNFTSTSYRNGLRLLSREAERPCARDSLSRGTAMRSASVLFAGALAEALIEADAKPLNVRLASAVAVEVPSYSVTDAVAQCLARSLPDEVGELFATEPGSDAEIAAAAPIIEAVSACARAAGVAERMELSVAAARAMIATAAYRLVTHAGDANA